MLRACDIAPGSGLNVGAAAFEEYFSGPPCLLSRWRGKIETMMLENNIIF